ncbi:MAG: twin-arginine translocase TatA/TatE family subunit [Chloroflexi bacterium]|nr:twin-arginine translocase TatA/TatE family subunit [Chloroflexota bacterium]
MNFFGIGTLELLVILTVALIALGPGKTVEVARTIGRMTREARRTFTDIMDAASLDERGGRAGDSASPSPQPSPPTDPVPPPPHLAAQNDDADNPTASQPSDQR